MIGWLIVGGFVVVMLLVGAMFNIAFDGLFSLGSSKRRDDQAESFRRRYEERYDDRGSSAQEPP
ncbi:MAG: hypothetical protein CMH83_18565 [Nocardioides sp.]|nr:hypothetical protein [Nocardioides sp.]